MSIPDVGFILPTTVSAAAAGTGEQPSNSNNNAETATGGTTYPFAGRNLTRSGHVFELNDTPAGERVLVKHRSGSEIDMLPDGSVAIGSKGKLIMTINNDMSVTVHGNLNYEVQGDINFTATGGINLNAADINVNTSGNVTQNIGGAYRTNVMGNTGLIAENVSVTSLNSHTTTVLGDNNLVVNGTNRITSEGNTQIASGGNLKVTAVGDYNQASANANIAATSMSVIGSTGTMGGQGIVMYGKGATFGEGVTAPTFHGDLDGTAAFAVQADVTNSQNYADPDPGGGVGSAVGYTVDNIATPTTATPTAAVLSEYLNVSDKGIVQVDVDETSIRNMIRRNVFNGGFSNRELTENDIRGALRDPANVNNSTLINNYIARGTISPTSIHPLPTEIGRVSRAGVSDQYFGFGATDNPNNPFFATAPVSIRRRFVPPLGYYITNETQISASTELLPGIRLSSFLRYSAQTDTTYGER